MIRSFNKTRKIFKANTNNIVAYIVACAMNYLIHKPYYIHLIYAHSVCPIVLTLSQWQLICMKGPKARNCCCCHLSCFAAINPEHIAHNKNIPKYVLRKRHCRIYKYQTCIGCSGFLVIIQKDCSI